MHTYLRCELGRVDERAVGHGQKGIDLGAKVDSTGGQLWIQNVDIQGGNISLVFIEDAGEGERGEDPSDTGVDQSSQLAFHTCHLDLGVPSGVFGMSAVGSGEK